jgi:Flp pilus assembly secretin CpaC
VIVVTPQIVKPGTTAPSTLPTDNVRVPDDFDLYLLGEMFKVGPVLGPGAEGPGVPRSPRELEGRFGHELPF